MKSDQLRQLTDPELEDRIRESREGLFNLKIKHATGQLEDSASVRHARRDLARALTVSAQRRKSQ